MHTVNRIHLGGHGADPWLVQHKSKHVVQHQFNSACADQLSGLAAGNSVRQLVHRLLEHARQQCARWHNGTSVR